FTPNENRQTVDVESNFTTKLANVEGVSTTVLTGRNMDNGKVEARELKSSMPGQTFFDSDNQIKTDIGDPIDVIEKAMEQKISIDLERGSDSMITVAILYLQDGYVDLNEGIVEFTDVENNDLRFVIDNNGVHFEIYPLNRAPEYTVKVNTLP